MKGGAWRDGSVVEHRLLFLSSNPSNHMVAQQPSVMRSDAFWCV
ncbi:rCG30440 [Rattus norvegicus]|uniref:RCG30440 n=1 Tax=Rattus norvegicus TaxID=10116 RepID=A6JFF6_RAT|nr:rCG30440 [Rattus norvegicus]